MSVLLLAVPGCMSYYQAHSDFNKDFESGDLHGALEALDDSERQAQSKARFVYHANRGLVLSVLGRYEESNEALEKAFLFGEDYRINYVNEVVSYWSNPTVTIYRGEDHEHLMVLYYKALNFLKMARYDEALVECRRLNIRLQQLSDKYTSEKKYQHDAFIHNLMGIIYQAAGDYNNAFIAYRNAYDIYSGDYQRMFNMGPPEQLKHDLVNTADWSGFHEDAIHYQQLFGWTDSEVTKPGASLVFFWHNGLSPVKDSWSINFLLDRRGDRVIFFNESLGLAFPFELDDDGKNDLASLEVFRVAFPRYVERHELFERAALRLDDAEYDLEAAEDISKIAFHSLHERMMLEFSKGLLRAALKKSTEYSLRKEDEMLGALIGMINAATEQADTRNWQTLPHTIYYSRVPLKPGKNDVSFTLYDQSNRGYDHAFSYDVRAGETLFHTFSSLETAGLAVGPSGY